MCGAFRKARGTVASVHIGQVVMFIRTELQNKEHVIEALHGLSSSSLASRRFTSPRSGDLLSLSR